MCIYYIFIYLLNLLVGTLKISNKILNIFSKLGKLKFVVELDYILHSGRLADFFLHMHLSMIYMHYAYHFFAFFLQILG